MKKTQLTLIILLLALAATIAHAATYDVKLDGTGDFSSIQDATDATADGDTIIVHPGTYYENICFNGKNIVLRSTDPDDWDVVQWTIINGQRLGSVVTFDGTEDDSCVLAGFTITDGDDSGIVGTTTYEGAYATALIRNCTITGNRGHAAGGIRHFDGLIKGCVISNNSGYACGGLCLCRGRIENCLVIGNRGGLCQFRAGGFLQCGDIVSCTIAHNFACQDGSLSMCHGENVNLILWDNEGGGLFLSSATYSCVQGGPWSEGEGNFRRDPMFVSGPFGDYYLHPDSPCIDAGSQSADEAGLSDRTTQSDGTADRGIVDLGFHYPKSESRVDVEVSCSANAAEFEHGDVLQGFMSVNNRGVDIIVDIFAGIVMPDGSVASLTQHGFAVGTWPWYSDLILPSGFTAGPEMVFGLVIPADTTPGSYTYIAEISRPGMGSLGLLSGDQCPFEISGITMLPIPAGSFLMGSSDDEEGRDDDEGPQRKVNMPAFEISRTEVTQEQWDEVMGWNDSYFSGDDHPVENVTWHDCVSFCNKLSDTDGLMNCYTIAEIDYDGHHIEDADVTCNFDANGYRLPTEAEWEYACRAGTTTRYCWGDVSQVILDSFLISYCWYDRNADEDYWTDPHADREGTQPVALKKPNAFGLYDMHGNIWEWCWDWYDGEYYRSAPDPDSDPMGPTEGDERVRRGGSWQDGALHCRCAERSRQKPDHRRDNIGLRLVRRR